MSLRLIISEIADLYVRRNFQILQDYLNSSNLFSNFESFEVTFTTTSDSYKFVHKLGILPKDVFVTSQIGSGTFEVLSSLATADFIYFKISGSVTSETPLTVRFIAGTASTG